MIRLRLYQARAKQAAHDRVAAGIRKLLLVAPTGAGKTVIFASIIESAVEKKSPCLILAHRRELIKQPFCRFVRSGIDPALIGVMLAGIESGPTRSINVATATDDELWSALARRRPSAPVQVASIDSIRNRAKPPAKLVIIDEAHRVLGASYLKLAEEYPEAVFVGVTATPMRADNKPMGDFFEDLIIVSTYRELVAQGFLVEPRVFTVPAQELPDLSRVRIKGSDYDVDQLSQACDQSGIVGNIVEHWQRHGNNAPTFCFAVNVAHSQNIASRFRDAGVSAVHVDANTPVAQRDAALRDLRNGTIKVVCNVDVCTEGVDVPNAKTIVLARPTKSLRIFLQQVGRASRPCDSGLPFILLDHAGSVIELGVPQCIEFSRDVLFASRPKSASMAPAKTCPDCFAVIGASTPICPECQHEFKSAPRAAMEEHDGELVEVRAPTTDELRADWTRICAECVDKGHKPGWVWVRWKEMHPGSQPPEGCKPPSGEAVQKVNIEQIADLDARTRTVLDKGQKFGVAKMGFKNAWHRFPSFEMFKRTECAKEIQACMAAFGWLIKMPPVLVEVDAPQPDGAANDVETIEYAV